MTAATPSRLRRFWLWLDRKGWWSTWEHVEFDFGHYFDLRDNGVSHKDAIRWLDAEWDKRRPTA